MDNNNESDPNPPDTAEVEEVTVNQVFENNEAVDNVSKTEETEIQLVQEQTESKTEEGNAPDEIQTSSELISLNTNDEENKVQDAQRETEDVQKQQEEIKTEMVEIDEQEIKESEENQEEFAAETSEITVEQQEVKDTIPEKLPEETPKNPPEQQEPKENDDSNIPNKENEDKGDNNPTLAHVSDETNQKGSIYGAEAQSTIPSSLYIKSQVPKTPVPSCNVSAVENAAPSDVNGSYRDDQTQPLSLDWTFGFNRHVGCINLSDSMRNLVLYSAAHIAVMYDYENNAQKLLQGHANTITCMACSEDKRWIVSADKGKESTVIVWDSYTGIPVHTIFNVHNNQGCVAIAMSLDAKYIVTVSAESPQVVSVWDWTNSDKPLCSTELNYSYGNQNYIQFHPTNNKLFVTNSDSQVVFYSWSGDTVLHHAPPLSDDVFNRVVGGFSQSIFQTTSNRALTATGVGNIVVWEAERQNVKAAIKQHKKRALKLVRMQDRSISTLTQTDTYIVTGDVMGQVKFYDHDLNMINWYQGLNVGTIKSLSFKYEPDINMDKLAENVQYPNDATIPATRFIVKDFIVSTKDAEIKKVITEGSQYVSLLQEHDASVHALAACPTKPVICIGSYAGLIKLWDFERKKCQVTRIFDKGIHVQCVAFSPTGLEIAVGMTNGAVYIVDAVALEDEITQPFRYAKDSITKCVFSHDSRYLATADADNATTVFKFSKENGWHYLGRYRAHYKSIQDISFGVSLDSNEPTLLSLGKDRILVEYDLANSHKDDLRVLTFDRIEQSAVPLCLEWYPVSKESFFVCSNDQYKFKLYNTVTKMCRKTLLSPTYGSPIKKMCIVPLRHDADPDKRILAYITDHKVGLQMLPLDGNPHTSVASIAHPSAVSHLTASNDGNYLFTAGGKDSSVHMWSISQTALEAAAKLGGDDLEPFYGLLEGGRNGELFAELENYFYYAQLRTQGLKTTDRRSASTSIDIEQVPFVMRALGYYPSEEEIEDIQNEIKFSDYVDSGEYVDKIDLGDLIKLYINHRPAFGLAFEDLQKAFSVLGRTFNKEGDIDKMDLLSVLQRKGEHMTEQELAENLATLLGYIPEGGSTSLRKDYFVGEMASEFLNTALPDNISSDMFSEEVLGLPVYEG